jgi:hypothetical protein
MNQTYSLLTRLLFRFLPFIWLISCITPIDFDVENKGGQIVISGQVSSLPDRNEIQIGITADSQLPVPVTGATVQLLDDLGNGAFYFENKEGVYILPGFQGIPGRTYHIMITLPNGVTYESIPEKMPEFAAPVDVSTEFTEEVYTDGEGANLLRRFVKLYASTSLPSEWKIPYINWTVEEVYKLSPTDFPDPFGMIPPPCFIAQKADPNRISLYDGTQVRTKEVEKVLVCSRLVDRSFLEKHYFNTYQSSLTPEAHAYWNKVNILANQTGSIFDTPPAQITGNVFNANNSSQKVWGYFQATHETQNRLFLLPTDFPFLVFFPLDDCTYDPYRFEYPQYCNDCTSIRNSTYNRPDWF